MTNGDRLVGVLGANRRRGPFTLRRERCGEILLYGSSRDGNAVRLIR